MNTIVAEMPRADAAGGKAEQGRNLKDDKKIKFDEILKGWKVHTAKENKKQEYDSEDGTVLFAGAELSALFYVPGESRMTGEMCPDILCPEEKTDSAPEVRTLLPVDADTADLRTAGTKGQMMNISGHAEPAGEKENVKIPAEKSGMPMMPEEDMRGNNPLTMAEAEESPAVLQTGRQPEETDMPEVNERRSNPEMNAAAVKDFALAGKTAEHMASKEVMAEPKPAHDAGIRTEYMDRLKTDIVKQVASGKQQFEIELHPKNLGTLVVKAAYEAGKTVISIVCSEAKTMQAMSQQAGELAGIMEARTGNETEVIVEKPAGDYLQQQQEQNGRGQERESDRQQRKNQKEEFYENFDFLQQLRLGLT